MSTPVKDKEKKLLLGELRTLLDDLRQVRSVGLSEHDDAARSDYLSRRVKVAREKLDDLKGLKKKEKEVSDRRREIERGNKRKTSTS